MAPGRQLSTNLAGEVVILDVQQGLYYGLDAVGAEVWSTLQAPSSVADIVDRIVTRYDVDRATAYADVEDLLLELLTLGLIEHRVAPPS
jgi:hypothetical protein